MRASRDIEIDAHTGRGREVIKQTCQREKEREEGQTCRQSEKERKGRDRNRCRQAQTENRREKSYIKQISF